MKPGVCPPVRAVPGSRGQEDGERGPQLEGGTSTSASPLGEGMKPICTHLCVDVYITLGCSRLLFVTEGSIENTSSLLSKENMSLKEIPEEGEG